jgi:hypothetical protein
MILFINGPFVGKEIRTEGCTPVEVAGRILHSVTIPTE